MTHGSLFSGIGGFDLAAEWMGWENVFHCEIEEFPRTVLKYYWPKAISYEDITKTDFTIHRGRIDILTGGFPCQPFSVAGKRQGTADHRHLWPEMLRAIREIEPVFIVGENVPGIVNWNDGMVFEQVCVDLENEGYEIIPVNIPAASVGAPHKRERIWFIAYSCSESRKQEFVRRREINRQERESIRDNFKSTCKKPYATNASNPRSEGLQRKRENGIYGSEFITNSSVGRLEGRRNNGLCKQEELSQFKRFSNSWIFTNAGLQPCEEYRKAKSGFFTEERFSDYWESFPTQSPVCDGNDGLPSRLDGITFPKWRNESIKAGGNAIVSQVALQIFKAIEKVIQSELF